jgi:hypothetical protein
MDPALPLLVRTVFTPRHDAHGIPGEVAAGPRDGRVAVVAPADPPVQGAGQLHARLRPHVAVPGSFSQLLAVALDGWHVRALAELLAALG